MLYMTTASLYYLIIEIDLELTVLSKSLELV